MKKTRAIRGALVIGDCVQRKLDRTQRSNLRRGRDRGSHYWDVISGILDTGYVAHLGFCVAEQMLVIPTMYGRDGRTLYLHGSIASRLLRELDRGIQVCVTVTLIDGSDLSRSVHSMNYRSVVAFGKVHKINDPEEQLASLRLISEHLVAGRWPEVPAPSTEEPNATTVLRFSIDKASAKIRGGPPQDEKSDFSHPVWAGILPLELKALPSIPDDNLCEGTPIPAYVLQYIARLRGGLSIASEDG